MSKANEIAYRQRMRKNVAQICLLCRSCMLVGSWAHDDYHLNMRTHESFSDIDVFCASDCKLGAELVSVPGITNKIRCSRRNERYESHISLDESNLLATFLLGQAVRGSHFYMYNLAKVSLLWLRTAVSERYQAVAERISDRAFWQAFYVKVGFEHKFDAFVTECALSTISHYPWASCIAELLEEHPILAKRIMTWQYLANYTRQHVTAISPNMLETVIAKANVK